MNKPLTVLVSILCMGPSIAINCTHALPSIPNAAASAGFVLLAGCSPFVLRHAMRRREPSLVIIALLAFIICGGFNLANALGSAADQRAEKTGSRAGTAEKVRLLKEALAQLEAKRAPLVAAQGPLSRKVDALDKDAAAARAELGSLAGAGAGEGAADPQAANIASVLAVAGVDVPVTAIATGLNVWFALGLEVLASLGPIVFATLLDGAAGQPVRPATADGQPEPASETPATRQPRARGKVKKAMDPVEAFLKACTIGKDDAETTAADVYLAWLTWTATNAAPVLSPTALGRKLSEMGYQRTKRGGIARYRNVELKGGSANAAKDATTAPRLKIVQATL